MAFFPSSSSFIINGSTFDRAQDFHIHNRDSESGMHDFRFIQKNIFINDQMKDLIIWNKEFLLERFMTQPNVSRRQIAILIPARPFDRLS